MSAIFITATGTDVGKTFVAASLIRHLRQMGHYVDAIKPIVSGFDPAQAATSDPGVLLTALGRQISPDEIERTSPWRFRDPVSPDLAARRDGSRIDFAALSALCREAIARHRDALIIEGVGGIMVPLDARHTVLDWMIEIDLPVLVVVGSYVGTLSHTLTALDVLERNDLKVAAVVVSETPASAAGLEDTASTIRRFVKGIEVLALPRLPDASANHPVMASIADLL